MKILFISSQSADYVQDLTYAGLVKKFGAENVIDFKWNKKFHVPYKKYPKNLGYTSGTIISSIRSRFPFKFDIVFVGASKVDCFHFYEDILKSIPANIPIIFIDGGDQPRIGADLTIYGEPELYESVTGIRPFDVIFKREVIIGDEYPENVYPLPMSFNLDRRPGLPTEKKYDVSFWAVESHDIRIKALELLQNNFDCKDNGTVRKQKFSKYKRKGDYYLQELARCKIVLNLRGGGWDTLRYWEVPAIGGFMITQKPGIVIPNDFENEKHVVHCHDDLDDLIDKCEFYLRNSVKREEIAKNAFSHLKRYHTDTERVKYIFSILSEHQLC